jgi:hypothetical protein
MGIYYVAQVVLVEPDKCLAKCRFCDLKQIPKIDEVEINPKALQRFLRYAKDTVSVPKIAITGGNASHYPPDELLKTVAVLSDYFPQVELRIQPGLILTHWKMPFDVIEQLYSAGLTNINFNLSACTRPTYELVYDWGSEYHHVIRFLADYGEYKSNNKRSLPEPEITTYLNKLSIRDAKTLEDFLIFVLNLKFFKVNLKEIRVFNEWTEKNYLDSIFAIGYLKYHGAALLYSLPWEASAYTYGDLQIIIDKNNETREMPRGLQSRQIIFRKNNAYTSLYLKSSKIF